MTGSYSKLSGGNTFIGTQIVSGSTFIAGDLIVQGSSSIQYISASSVSIGTNTINLNTNVPAVRFAGISIFDSGSNAQTASIFWDGFCNKFIYSNPSSVGYSGGMLMSGPRNTGSIGEENGLTTGYLAVAQGSDHISSSAIYHTTSSTCFYGNTTITSTGVLTSTNLVGTICANNGVISGSSQVDGTLITNKSITIAGTSTALGGTITLATMTGGSAIHSGSYLATATTANLSENTNLYYTDARVKTKLDAETVVSGSKTISGITLGSNLATLTIGTGLSGTSYNGSTGVTIANTITNNNQLTNGAGYITSAGNAATVTNGVYTNTVNILTDILRVNSKLVIQDSLDGTSARGIYMWNSGDTNWGIYMSQPGAGKSLANGTAPAGLGGESSHAIRFRIAGANNSFIWENYTEQAVMSLSGAGALNVRGDVTAYSSSDIRLKDNIKLIEDPIEKIKKIKGISFVWNDNMEQLNKRGKSDYGVIAQEIEQILPEIVQTRDNGYKAVQYEKLTPLLIEAIKEQQIKIDNLTIEVENLKKPKGL